VKTTLLLALDTFEEARRRRIVLAALVMVALFLVLYGAGLYFLRRELSADTAMPPSVSLLIRGEMLTLGLWTASFITSLVAIFLSAGVIRNDVEQGYAHVLLARPVSRNQMVIGRWIGLQAMITVLSATVTVSILLAANFIMGYSPSSPVLVVAVLTAQPLILVSLAVLGSVFLPSIGNGIVVFVLFMIAMVAGTVEQIGYLARQHALTTAGKVIGFLVPTDIPWRQAAALAQPDILSSIPVMGPFSALAVPTVWMDLYILLYSLLCLVLAATVFSYKDL
jgi:ABC-type transport system involved in multi-copper enzyme maturation permease subunit